MENSISLYAITNLIPKATSQQAYI